MSKNNNRDGSKDKIINISNTTREQDHSTSRRRESSSQIRENSLSQSRGQNKLNSNSEKDSKSRDPFIIKIENSVNRGHKSRSQTPSKVTFDIAAEDVTVLDNNKNHKVGNEELSFEWVDFKTDGKAKVIHIGNFKKCFQSR